METTEVDVPKSIPTNVLPAIIEPLMVAGRRDVVVNAFCDIRLGQRKY